MVVQDYPIPRGWHENADTDDSKALKQNFAEAVAAKEAGSADWWNGVAAAANGIALQMSYEWLEGKGCPLEGFYDAEGTPGARTSVLQEQLLQHLLDVAPDEAVKLAKVLELFRKYPNNGGPYTGYMEDVREAQSNLDSVVKNVSELAKRQLTSVCDWMEDQLPPYPTKSGYDF